MLLAHYNQKTATEQSLDEHLLAVAQQMSDNLSFLNMFSLQQTDYQRLFAVTGCYHDIGKAMQTFQNYLKTGQGGKSKNHALISAAILSNQLGNDSLLSFLAVAAVALHHQNINTTPPDEYSSPQLSWLERQDNYCRQALAEEGLQAVAMPPNRVKVELFEKYWGDALDDIYYEDNDQYFFLLQFLFSRLVWADKLDSAGIKSTKQNTQFKMSNLHAYLNKNRRPGKSSLNDKREQIRCQVIDKINSLSDAEIMEKRIFTLTAPTGTGKTLTSISAAITLAEKIKISTGKQPQIITAIPFINIIEQTKGIYQDIFQDVLVHCSAAEVTKNSIDSEMPLNERFLLTEAWESQVILTTFVQLFESILTANNGSLIKMHQLGGAIVILDEVQALPAKYYPLLGAIICRLAKYYGTRFIMMTATQPEIINSAQILLGNEVPQPIELLENSLQYYLQLHRTKLVPIFDVVNDLESLADFIIKTRSREQTALVVVNTIAVSIALYNILQERYNHEVIILYLSTNATGFDRKKTIELAQKLLNENYSQPFIMVSTQTIEAGVDLDFDIGFRDIAPLESIIQVAGRVNRSATKQAEAPVYIFDLHKAAAVYHLTEIRITKSLLQQEIKESEYHLLMQQYFKCMADGRITYDDKIYKKGILKLDYEVIEEFKLIDGTQRSSVIIMQNEEVEKIVNKFCELIKTGVKDYETRAKIRQLNRQIGMYTVDLFPQKLQKNCPCTFKSLYDLDLNYYVVPQSELERYYNETGFIADNVGAYFY